MRKAVHIPKLPINVGAFNSLTLQRNFGSINGDIHIEVTVDGEHWSELDIDQGTSFWPNYQSDILIMNNFDFEEIRFNGLLGSVNGEQDLEGRNILSHLIVKGS